MGRNHGSTTFRNLIFYFAPSPNKGRSCGLRVVLCLCRNKPSRVVLPALALLLLMLLAIRTSIQMLPLEAKMSPPVFPWKTVRSQHVDCAKLLAGDRAELARAKALPLGEAGPSPRVPALPRGPAHCPEFVSSFGLVNSSLTRQEEDFPIAYSVVVFKDLEQVLELLRAIYRPQNLYCVHVDLKASADYRGDLKAVADCLPNVFMASRSVDVRWGKISVLEPELICMKDLWKYKKWKYFINLTGQEFPLKTNWELVQILTAYKGANNLEGTRKRANKDRWAQAGPPPDGLLPAKGSVHVAVSRDLVDFVLHNATAGRLLQWVSKGSVPDETFFSTLNHNPQLGIRGTYRGEAETDPVTYPFLTRFKNWGGYPFDYPCAGKRRVRGICIWSAGDLPMLGSRPELFANKFHWDWAPSRLAVGCLAETLHNRTRDQLLGMADPFNVTFYASQSFVTNRLT